MENEEEEEEKEGKRRQERGRIKTAALGIIFFRRIYLLRWAILYLFSIQTQKNVNCIQIHRNYVPSARDHLDP